MDHESTLFEMSQMLGRRVRRGSWDDQAVGTFTKTRDAIIRGDNEEGALLLDFFMQEANVIYSVYTQLNPDVAGFLLSKGLSEARVEDIRRHVVALCALPDGRTFDRESLWAELGVLAEECRAAIAAGSPTATHMLDDVRELWRQLKDRDGDVCYGLIDAVVKEFGEGTIGEMWDVVIKPLFIWRYAKFDLAAQPWDTSLDTLMMVACESMRGHLVGVDRTGDFELTELDDRYVLRFDPCGSGGRIVRGDRIEGTPSRMEAPYNWSVSAEPHTWNHDEDGICHYCTHCIRLMEEMPIERFGYPLRVVDPPRYPDSHGPDRQYCQWQMFKDPTAVPVEFYARVGRSKPATFGGSGVVEHVREHGFPGNG